MARSMLPSQDCRCFNKRPRCRRNRSFHHIESTVIKLPAQSNHLVFGQVHILKRGQTVPVSFLTRTSTPELDHRSELVNSNTLEKIVKVHDIGIEKLYFSGFVFQASPPPSCVPVPRFLARNCVL